MPLMSVPGTGDWKRVVSASGTAKGEVPPYVAREGIELARL